MYVKQDSNGQDGVTRYWVDDQQIDERLGATDNDGGQWYPWHIISNWSNNPGWEHDADNRTCWDDIEVFSDAGKGDVTGTMGAGDIVALRTNAQ